MPLSVRSAVLSVPAAAVVLAVAFVQGAPRALAQAPQLPGLNQTETQNVQLVIRNLDALVTTFEAAGQNAGQGINPNVKVVVPSKETAGGTTTVKLNDYFHVEVAQYRQVLTNLQAKFQGHNIHSIPGLNSAPPKYMVGDPNNADDVKKALHPNAAFCVPGTYIKMGTTWVPCPEGDIVIDSSHTDPGNGAAIDESIGPPQLKQGQQPPPGQHGWAEKWQLLHILVHEKWHERMIAEQLKLTEDDINKAKGKTGQGPGIDPKAADQMRQVARTNGADGEHHKQVYMAQKAVLYLEYESLKQDLATQKNNLTTLQRNPGDNAAAITTTQAAITLINQKMAWLLSEVNRVETSMKHATDKEFEYAGCGGAGNLHDGTIAIYATGDAEYFRVDVDLAGGSPTDSRLAEVFLAGEVHQESDVSKPPALYVAMAEDVFTGLEVQSDTCDFLAWATANGWVHTGPDFTSIANFVPHLLTENIQAGAESPGPITPIATPAQQPGNTGTTPPSPRSPAPTQTSQFPNTDYGTGGKLVQQTDSTGAVLEGTVYDSTGTLRHDETFQYALNNGKQYKIEKDAFNYDFKGHLQLGLQLKYDVSGALNSSDFTHYGLHGERSSEEITDYKPTGYEIKDWSLSTHKWTSFDTTYKFPTIPGTPTPPPIPYTPTNTTVGVLFPRNFHPGDTITGSLWSSSYADNFKTVPGLSEYDFPIQLYHLPDGSPSWSSLEIGVKGDGYVPVSPNGLFSLHIPLNWSGPLTLQALQPDPVNGFGPSLSSLDIGNPIAAPTLPDHALPAHFVERLQYWQTSHLVHLWNECYDLENDLDDAYAAASPNWEEIDEMEGDLEDCYDDIDEVASSLPTDVVVELAKGLARDARDYHAWLSAQPNLTADDKDDLIDSSGWASFLDDEAGYATFRALWGVQAVQVNPFWTNPVLTQGKLGALRGYFPSDPIDTSFRIGDFPITPIAATPSEWYFMPPNGLSAGQNNFIVDSPLFPETILPVFYMTLTMSADNLNMHKGQSTTYHVRLDGLNGLPGGAWNAPFYPTDLVDPSEWSGAQSGSSGASRTGYVTLDVTNQSIGVISMQNVFSTLNASFFAPSGSYQLNGPVGAIKDGGFSILGVARAYLDPELGLGASTTAPSTPATSGYDSNWLPSLNLSYDPSTLTKSPFMTECSATTAPATTEEGASTSICMGGEDLKLFNQAIGNQSSVQVGNPPAPSDIDAAKQRLLKAATNVKAAADKLTRLGKDMDADWNAAVKDLAQDDQDDYHKVLKRYLDSVVERAVMQQRSDANPTVENQEKFEAAEKELAIDEGIYRRFKEFMIDRFTPQDRAAWQASRDAVEKAQADRSAAESEFNAAESALGELQRAAATN